MVNKAVSNTGPLMHLNEINLVESLKCFKEIFIPLEVKMELDKHKIKIPNFIKIISLKPQFINIARELVEKFLLDLGESHAIALTLQERADYFLTDDLDARIISKKQNIETHGTLGIILRAFRENLISKGMAIDKVKEIYYKSSLFVTKYLIKEVINSIKDFKR